MMAAVSDFDSDFRPDGTAARRISTVLNHLHLATAQPTATTGSLSPVQAAVESRGGCNSVR